MVPRVTGLTRVYCTHTHHTHTHTHPPTHTHAHTHTLTHTHMHTHTPSHTHTHRSRELFSERLLLESVSHRCQRKMVETSQSWSHYCLLSSHRMDFIFSPLWLDCRIGVDISGGFDLFCVYFQLYVHWEMPCGGSGRTKRSYKWYKWKSVANSHKQCLRANKDWSLLVCIILFDISLIIISCYFLHSVRLCLKFSYMNALQV